MKLLIFSDIHNNIKNLKILREKEINNFDALIIAGDIGNKIKKNFFSIVDSFNCPAFCVFGNWDYYYKYEKVLSNNCILLNHNIEKINDYFITGFSGSSVCWGGNPIYLKIKEKIKNNHKEIFTKIEEEESRIKNPVEEIEKKFKNDLKILQSKTKDRRRKKYQDKLYRLERRKKIQFNKIYKDLNKLYDSKEYNEFKQEVISNFNLIFEMNRNKLFSTIKSSKIPNEKLIIVTHERMYKIDDEGVTPLLHVFGHRHFYKFSNYKGTNYLNTSAIDNGFLMKKNSTPEGYCVVTIEDKNVTVERINLFESE